MNSLSVPSASDMDCVAERLIPFAPRGENREGLKELAREYKEKLSNIESLVEGKRLSCPVCMSSENVIIVGNGRNGTKKFLCRTDHIELEGRSDGAFRFSTYTSYEALKVYRDFLTEAMSLLTLCGGTYEGIAEYLGISTYAVELGVSAFADYIKTSKKKGVIELDGDLAVIYADFSGTRISRAASIIMSRIGDKTAYQVVCGINSITAWNFVSSLKKTLVLQPGTTIVFVTDGERAWIDPIRKLFPEAVHIRQFHCKSARGIVYVHFPYGGKTYTFRCLWDIVLEEGECSGRTMSMRRRRAAAVDRRKDRTTTTTELYEGVILWDGIVYEPRGVRRKKGATGSGVMKRPDDMDRYPADGEAIVPDAVSESVFGEQSRKAYVAPDGDASEVKEIFRGTIEEALTLPQVMCIYGLLAKIFGGLHITSNAVECLFSVKPALKSHRAVKNGDKLISVVLYARTALKSKSREEIKEFFQEVFTLDRLKSMVIHRDGKLRENRKEVESVIFKANNEGAPIVIRYQDGRGKRTSRMIDPLGIETDPYSGMVKVKAHCYLRNDKRTFLLDRIGEAIPQNLDLTVVG